MEIRIHRSWRWWPINRPHLQADVIGPGRYYIGLSWGNGNSDPVWSIGLDINMRHHDAKE